MQRKTSLSLTLLLGAFCLIGCDKKAAPSPAHQTASPSASAPEKPVSASPAPPHASTEGPLTHFKAYGVSPAWRVEVTGETLSFEVPETMGPDSKPISIPVSRIAYAKGVNFTGDHGKVPVTLDVRSEPTLKNGNRQPFTATFTYGKSTYKGGADGSK